METMMKKPVSISIQEPLNDQERELMDPGTWDWDRTEEGVPNPKATAILEIEFTRDELARLAPVTRAAGMTMHAFIKRLALAASAERPRSDANVEVA